MFLKTERRQTAYKRTSKLGQEHEYYRVKTIAVFRCDNCDEQFERDVKNVESD